MNATQHKAVSPTVNPSAGVSTAEAAVTGFTNVSHPEDQANDNPWPTLYTVNRAHINVL